MKKTLMLTASLISLSMPSFASADCLADVKAKAVDYSEIVLISRPGPDANKLAYIHVELAEMLPKVKTSYIVTHTDEGRTLAAQSGFTGDPLLIVKKEGRELLKCTPVLK